MRKGYTGLLAAALIGAILTGCAGASGSDGHGAGSQEEQPQSRFCQGYPGIIHEYGEFAYKSPQYLDGGRQHESLDAAQGYRCLPQDQDKGRC